MHAVIVIPSRHRAAYLDVALASVAPQAATAGVPVLVVDDGPDEAARATARRHGAEVVELPTTGRGINVARNAGVAAASAHDADWLLLLDDDVAVHPGWLDALLTAAQQADDDVAFLTGPVHARFEDHPLRSCGRERPPITTLDLGDEDRDAPTAYGVNVAVRAAELARVGPFDEGLVDGGDEEELLVRSGRRIRYVAAAGVDHLRVGDDARLRSLARARRVRGRAARRYDVARGAAPSLRRELLVLLGCLGHLVRYRCPQGLVMAAHSLGRIEEAWDPTPRPATPGVDDFTSGRSGTVGGLRGELAAVQDRLLDLRARATRPTAAGTPRRRRVLVVGVERPGSDFPAARAELTSSGEHEVVVRTSGLGGRGKFENLNALLAAEDVPSFDWVLVVDDDVVLPRGFLGSFLAEAEREGYALAQPAHRRASHAAWPHTRRRPGAPSRTTTFVEIGPVTAFRADAAAELLPFPPVRMGWGLDAHWAAVAAGRGWKMGVVDAVPILHRVPVAQGYGREEALAEARAFLQDRPYLPRQDVR